jgi:hypothetical protein
MRPRGEAGGDSAPELPPARGFGPNVVVFIDGCRCTDRIGLADALEPGSTVHVLQALSGG